MANVEPGDRVAFIDQRCAGDAALRREVEVLVDALDAPGEFLDPGRIPTLDMAAVDGPLQPGTDLAGFLVLHAIGSGGMGVVYAAQQDRPRRTVAIKVLRRGSVIRRSSGGSSARPRCSDGSCIQASLRSSRSIQAPLPFPLIWSWSSWPVRAHRLRTRRTALDPGARRVDGEARRRRAARARARHHPSRSQAGQRPRRRRRPAEGARLRDCPRDRRRHAADHDSDRARTIDGHAHLHEPRATARTSRTRSTRAAMSMRSASCSTGCSPIARPSTSPTCRGPRPSSASSKPIPCRSRRSIRRSPARSSGSWAARCRATSPHAIRRQRSSQPISCASSRAAGSRPRTSPSPR